VCGWVGVCVGLCVCVGCVCVCVWVSVWVCVCVLVWVGVCVGVHIIPPLFGYNDTRKVLPQQVQHIIRVTHQSKT